MSLGDSYKKFPRVTSQYSYTTYAQLEKICQHMDFRHTVFKGRMKRNRSLGSVQAFIVELALNDMQFVDRLRKYMVRGGRDYVHEVYYHDKY